MKKFIFITVVFIIFSGCRTYAVDTRLLNLRNSIFDASQELKPLIDNSRDAVVLVSLFDSCLLTVTQIDAYFHMLGVFESAKKEAQTADSFDFILSWLSTIKNTTDSNINNLDRPLRIFVPSTDINIDKLKVYYKELKTLIQNESNRVTAIQKALKIKQKR